LDPQAAKRSIPEDNLVNTDNKVCIKRLSNAEFRKLVVITKCLCEPCPRVYTDTISESILIECKDPKHNTGIEKVEGREANPNPNQTSEQMQPSPGDDVPG
jgi:hypothetical protein